MGSTRTAHISCLGFYPGTLTLFSLKSLHYFLLYLFHTFTELILAHMQDIDYRLAQRRFILFQTIFYLLFCFKNNFTTCFCPGQHKFPFFHFSRYFLGIYFSTPRPVQHYLLLCTATLFIFMFNTHLLCPAQYST